MKNGKNSWGIKMRFSVLVPVYNVEQYFENCLESLLNQTYKDFEIILVNDGSTDESGRICDMYRDKNPNKIKVIHKKNQGLISARRVGIDNASGDYCIFVDSDDMIENNLLKVLNDYLENNEIDLLIYSFIYYRNNEKSNKYHKIDDYGKKWTKEEKKELYDKFLFSNDITPIWIKAVRTTILKNDPTDYTIYYRKNMAEDVLQSLYILTASDTVGYIYEPLYLYRINENSVSRSFRPETIHTKNTIHVYEKVKEYLEEWGLNDDEHYMKLQARWFNDIMYMFSRYCEEARNYKEMQVVFNADWNPLFPIDVLNNRNEFENKVYQDLYKWLKNNNYTKIHLYFLKKKAYKTLKQIKSKVFK